MIRLTKEHGKRVWSQGRSSKRKSPDWSLHMTGITFHIITRIQTKHRKTADYVPSNTVRLETPHVFLVHVKRVYFTVKEYVRDKNQMTSALHGNCR